MRLGDAPCNFQFESCKVRPQVSLATLKLSFVYKNVAMITRPIYYDRLLEEILYLFKGGKEGE